MLRHIIIHFKTKALRNGKRWSRINVYFKQWKFLFEDINDFNFEIKVTLLYIEFLLAYF